MKEVKSVLIIYNPNAMKGKISEHLPHIKQRLSLRYEKIDAMATPVEGAEDIAYSFAPKYDIIVSCGGDGTLHEIINGVMKSGSQPTIAILPFGTCNDVARTFKIPFNLDEAIDCILRLNTTSYDVMFDGKDYITYALATGYLTKASYAASSKIKKKIGRLAYVFSGIRCMFQFDALPITITCDNERIHGKFVYLMAMNGESTGGFKLNKGEIINNGKVKLVMIKRGKGISSLFTFVKLFLFGIKSIMKSKNAIVREVTHFEIENHANTPFTLDGEKAKFLKKKIQVKQVLSIVKK
ncbi:MAG: YegS/Rv2252/BmrU family lipid kinase [Clostridia bacterium]|nr:YegS/Rv2252/BmrU family lipid kinase [Clostridia bacterium]